MSKKQHLAIGLAIFLAAVPVITPAAAATDLVYFGSHGTRPAGRPGAAPGAPGQPQKPDANGIFAARFDEASGKLTYLGEATKLERPTWIVANPEKPIIYSVNELGNDGKTQGQVVAYAVNRDSGDLAEINRVAAGGGGTTHLYLDQVTQTIFAANFGTGHVSAVPIKPDGSLAPVSSVVRDYGTGPNPRQNGPHAHAVGVDPSHRYVFAPDLGADRLFIYRFDDATRTLRPSDPPYFQFAPGTGPRHLAFYPDGRFVYMETELTAEIYGFGWDASHGKLREIQHVSTVPAGFKGEASGAEIAISRDARYLYSSNRSDDTVEVYKIDAGSGKISEIERIEAQGKNPWSFTIDPSGHWMLVTDEASNTVAVLKIDTETGKLSATGESMNCLAPVSAVFVRE